MIEAWSENGNSKSKRRAPRTPDYEKFVTNRVPQLLWQMEMDVFRSGDESGAALQMLKHIEKYITHKSARKWSVEFKSLLTPQLPTEEAAVPANN